MFQTVISSVQKFKTRYKWRRCLVYALCKPNFNVRCKPKKNNLDHQIILLYSTNTHCDINDIRNYNVNSIYFFKNFTHFNELGIVIYMRLLLPLFIIDVIK